MAEGGKKITVAVTSCNKEKLEAVDSAFASHFADASLQILSHSSDSGIPHGQPWGMQHTYEGALARLHHLKSSGALSCDYLVSAENGVCAILGHASTTALDVACVIIERRSDGKQAMNFSQGRPYPLQEVQEMIRAGASGKDVGEYCKQWYQEKKLPISRADQISAAASLALCLLTGE
ncbi:unnamed protein product [Effrenium voratum]|nr:unnamed protein product [Effrenium voratum]